MSWTLSWNYKRTNNSYYWQISHIKRSRVYKGSRSQTQATASCSSHLSFHPLLHCFNFLHRLFHLNGIVKLPTTVIKEDLKVRLPQKASFGPFGRGTFGSKGAIFLVYSCTYLFCLAKKSLSQVWEMHFPTAKQHTRLFILAIDSTVAVQEIAFGFLAKRKSPRFERLEPLRILSTWFYRIKKELTKKTSGRLMNLPQG